jgi:16S rRNA (uracil1498-N3)-methyltransferase
MHQFFLESPIEAPGAIWIEGEDARHIQKVLRMRAGELLYIVLNHKAQWLCEIIGLEEGRVQVRLMEEMPAPKAQPAQVVLYQGIPKSDKMDWIVQKATELGVARIVPVQMKRSVSRLDKKDKAEKKRARWQRIADEAAKQSKRLTIPAVDLAVSFEGVLKDLEADAQMLVAYEDEKHQGLHKPLTAMDPSRPIGIVVGPEGGFEAEEIEALRKAGAEVIGLGRRILRTETASLALITLIQYECGDLGL